MTATTHTTKSVEFIPADGSGNIDGWRATCTCGFDTSNSLGERWACRQLADHISYMASRRS